MFAEHEDRWTGNTYTKDKSWAMLLIQGTIANDAEILKLVNTVLGAVATLLCGYLSVIINARRAEEKEYKAWVAIKFEELERTIDKKTEELSSEVNNEIDRLQAKDNALGRDIQTTRAAFAFVCGKIGQSFPIYSNGGRDDT